MNSYSNLYSSDSDTESSVLGMLESESTQAPPPPPPPPEENIDSDGDDAWSLEELEAYAEFSSNVLGVTVDTDSIMETYDTDGDGLISSTEQAALMENNALNMPDGPPPPPPPEANIDTDGDDAWSLEELQAYADFSSSELGVELDIDSIMETYDTDGDGVINADERVSLMEDNALQMPEPPEKAEEADEASYYETIQEVEQSMNEMLLDALSGDSDSDDTDYSYFMSQLASAYNWGSTENSSTLDYLL
jgi:Ca2+-binding EF-hand superfamily protein